MPHTQYTLSLNEDWDIQADAVGRIRTTSGVRATAQNVANENRLFTNDAYFAKDSGIPHFSVTFGRRAPESALRSFVRSASLRVPAVAEVSAVRLADLAPQTRTLHGEITFTTKEGEDVSSTF